MGEDHALMALSTIASRIYFTTTEYIFMRV